MGETGEDGEQKGGRRPQGSPRAGGPALGRGRPGETPAAGADERPQHQVLPGGGGGLNNKVDRGLLCVEDPHPEGPCSRALRKPVFLRS
ncbi:unnamed protein product [Arctogadus glacialis]